MSQPLTNAQKQAAFRRRRDAQAKAWARLNDPQTLAAFRASLARAEAEEPGTAMALLRFKEAYIRALSSEPNTTDDDPRVQIAQMEARAAGECEGARFVKNPLSGIERIRLRSGEEIEARII